MYRKTLRGPKGNRVTVPPATQPLDQWRNSPFIGQPVGNCKNFTLTHYLADLFAMHPGPKSIPLCTQYHIQLTSLSFQVSWPSHSWYIAISIFYLENPRSRSWARSKLKVTTFYWLTSLSFHVIPEIRLFQNLTLKIHGQGHGWGERWKSQHVSSILLTHIPFIVNWPSYSWDMTFSKFSLENPRSRSWARSKLKVRKWL